MKNLILIYKLTMFEIEDFKRIHLDDFDQTIRWINVKLQEAFDEGRKYPIE